MNQTPTIIVFTLNGQQYGMPLCHVVRVLHAVDVTPVPKSTNVILGVVDVQNDIIPVIDIRCLLGLDAKPASHSDSFFVAEANATRAIFVADSVVTMKAYDLATMESVDGMVLSNAEYIHGVLRKDDELIFIIDIEKLLAAAGVRQLSPDRAAANVTPIEKSNNTNIIKFMLKDECYAIETAYIKRVYQADDITRLPCTPDYIEGLINLHGNVICVINLKSYFGLPMGEKTDVRRVLIASHRDMELGILADSILGIEAVDISNLQNSFLTLTGERAELLKGITTQQEIILDIPKMMMHKEFIINDAG